MSIARPISRGISRPISRGIVRGDAIDPDAAAVIAALEASGATVSGEQAAAIDEFHRTGKSQGWYDALKRFYLPIWGIAAPNAIDWIERGSGTFVGDVDHEAGYVKNSISSGFFDIGSTPDDLDITNNSALTSALLLSPAPATSANRSVIGARQSASQDFRMLMPSGGDVDSLIMSSSNSFPSSSDRLGILFFGRHRGTRFNAQRKTTGWSILDSEENASVGTAPTINIYALAFNFDGTAAGFLGSPIGHYAVGTGMPSSDGEKYTAALKTLWETCTGLSLP